MAAEARPTPWAAVPLTALQCLKQMMICLTYIGMSTLLIRFNKFMMHPDRFPFALALSTCHMLVSTVLSGLLYCVVPSMYPAMEATKGQRLGLMKWFVPIGACFAVMLFGSNKAYTYCSVALLQFMKEANVMVVFLISCAVGLQSINRMRVVLILWVIIGATISVSGDIKFSLMGIAFQAASQIAECVRMVLGEFLLSGRRFDPLTYTAFLAPTCFVVLLAANVCHWDPHILPALAGCWPLLLLNTFVAFLLNVLVATVIKQISATGFVLVGITKDILIVVLSCITFGEPVTRVQWEAFSMTLAGVGVWSLMKVAPDSWPIQMLERCLCMTREKPEEKVDPDDRTPLIDKKL